MKNKLAPLARPQQLWGPQARNCRELSGRSALHVTPPVTLLLGRKCFCPDYSLEVAVTSTWRMTPLALFGDAKFEIVRVIYGGARNACGMQPPQRLTQPEKYGAKISFPEGSAGTWWLVVARRLESCERQTPEPRRTLFKPRAAEQIRESRIAADGVKVWMHFEELQNIRLLFIGLLEPSEGLVVFTKS
jgi:hypothetical protein